MIVIVVMVVAWIAARLVGATGRAPAVATAVGALRVALAVMFVFTGAAHFLPSMRPDLIRMVPPALPWPNHLVTLTGILEIAGAIGLLIPRLVSLAAYCLAVLLVVMFPANAYATIAGVEFGGRAASPLVWRLPLQILWIAALIWVARAHRKPRAVLTPPLPDGGRGGP